MTHKKTTRLTAAWLCALLAAAAVSAASCGQETPDTPADTQTSVTTEAVTEEPARDLPDFGGRTFTIYSNEHSEREQHRFMIGPDNTTGDPVDDTVYERNLKVKEELNVNFEYFRSSANWDQITPELNKLIMAGDDTYDVITGSQYGVVKLMTNNCFLNVHTLEGFQFDEPWWNKTYMEELTLAPDVWFFMAGDYFTDVVRTTRVLYYNKTMYANYFDNGDGLYQMVLDGSWTMDKLSELTKAVYKDLDNDGKINQGDQVGYVTQLLMASVDPFVYGTDCVFINRESDGTISFNMLNDRNAKLAEVLTNFFYQEGSLVLDNGEHTKEFAAGNALFLGYSNFADSAKLRDMKDDFGYLPHPKLDESQKEYRSLIHDNAVIGTIPVTSKNTDMAGYILDELSRITHDTVLPAWYESALKVKYTRDNISAQVIDLIHDTAYTSFIYALSPNLSDIGMVYRTLSQQHSTNYVSTVEKKLPAAQKKLDEMLEIYRSNTK